MLYSYHHIFSVFLSRSCVPSALRFCNYIVRLLRCFSALPFIDIISPTICPFIYLICLDLTSSSRLSADQRHRRQKAHRPDGLLQQADDGRPRGVRRRPLRGFGAARALNTPLLGVSVRSLRHSCHFSCGRNVAL